MARAGSAPDETVSWLPGRPAAPALRVMLLGLGVGLPVASRVRPRMRSQITRSLVVEISTEDGVARHWAFDAPARRVSSRHGRAARADHALRFADSATALSVLASSRVVDGVVGEMHEGRVEVEGSLVVLLWFLGLTTLLTRRAIGPRRTLPGAYLAHDPLAHGNEQIVVEPAVQVLDPDWSMAWEARSRLWLVRAAAGEPMPEP